MSESTFGLGFFGVTFSVFGMLALGSASWLAASARSAVSSGQVASGRVVELVVVNDMESISYAPRVRFTAADGRAVEFVSKMSNHPPRYAVGQRVSVRYAPDHPQQAEVDDFETRWSTPLAFCVNGLVFTAAGVGLLLIRRRVRGRSPRISASE